MSYKDYQLYLNGLKKPKKLNLDWDEIDRGMKQVCFPAIITILFIIFLIANHFA